MLRDVFAFHPLAIKDCAQRNQVPKVHVYADHVFLVLHSPHAGAAGHVHTIELDQFVGDRYLVTVHGPLSAAADPAAARIEVDALAKRVESGGSVLGTPTISPTRSPRLWPSDCATSPPG
jgi:Mg2+ and Co2+ transporter CorA